MSKEKDTKSVATTSCSYDTMIDVWKKIQTLLNGTESMRRAGTKFLPQHSEESNRAYAERLSMTTLLNMSELILNSWVGRPFSDPVVMSENMPENVKDLMTNVDLLGNNLDVFVRNVFKDGVAKAVSHIYVDFPRRTDPEDRVRTLADDNKENLRPYWVHINPENLFFAHAEMENGVEKLMEIRIMEEVVDMVGFAESHKNQIRRVFLVEREDGQGRIGVVELYQEKKLKGKKVMWVVDDTYTFDLDFIPLVTFYSDRRSFMVGKPPLEDLVDLNISHWQSRSDQRSVLTVARFPILALSGGSNEEDKLTIGPKKWLFSPLPNSKFYYVEHTGKAIEAGRKDLQDLLDNMSEYGAEFLKKRPGGATATARALDSAEATSPLQDITMRFMDTINLALDYTAAWLKMEAGKAGTVLITTEFGPEEINGADLTALSSARNLRDLSRENFLKELKRRGILEDEFDMEENNNQLEAEALSFQSMSTFDEDEDEDKDEDDEEDDDKKNKDKDDEED